MNKITGATLQKMQGHAKTAGFLLLAAIITAILVWAAPARAYSIDTGAPVYQGELDSPLTFSITANIENDEMQWLQSISVAIFSEAQPAFVASLNNLPLNTSAVSYTAAQTGGGPVDVDVAVTSDVGFVYMAYDFTWTPPATWPVGTYKMTAHIVGDTGGGDLPIDLSIVLTAPTDHLPSPPEVICQWATPDDGDLTHALPGAQMLPSQMYQVDRPVSLFAVITDTGGINTISDAVAQINYPSGLPRNGALKAQSVLTMMDKQSGLAAIQSANSTGLITLGAGQNYNDILNKLNNDEAAVFSGGAAMHYDDPAGDYQVAVSATDTDDMTGSSLTNHFTYVPVAAVEIDFNAIDYGHADVGSMGFITGDYDFSTVAYPTVRNVGNTNLIITISQDDMGFGYTGGIPNVTYMAWLGDDGAVDYLPQESVVLPGVLNLSETASLNFALRVSYAQASHYSGLMHLSVQSVNFDQH